MDRLKRNYNEREKTVDALLPAKKSRRVAKKPASRSAKQVSTTRKKNPATPARLLSRSALASLPAEVIESIVSHLNFDGVCNLRLTTSEVAAKAFHEPFKTRFATKTVMLTLADLQRFVILTQPGGFGCMIEDLTLSYNIRPTSLRSQSLEDGDQISSLLVTLFTNLRTNTKSGRLRRLALALENADWWLGRPYCIVPWNEICGCTADKTQTVTHAIKLTGLPIEGLDLYSSITRCALSPTQTQRVFQTIQVSELRSLSLSVCGATSGEAADTPRLGLCLHLLLELAHKLEHLDLRHLELRERDRADPALRDEDFFSHLTSLSFPRLMSVSLRGIRTSAKNVQAFLSRNSQLRHLFIEEMHLTSGTFATIFAQIVDTLQLQSIHLSNLLESRVIHFTESRGEPYFPHPGPPTWIKREGPGTKRKIRYQFSRTRMKALSAFHGWETQRTRMYGPFDPWD